ncbi:MAG TPA: hypothetical protein VIG32_11320 [Candidatus Baltobacteraceae bacterium]
MRKPLLLLLLLALAACSNPVPSFTHLGSMAPGGSITVRNARGDISAYAPERGAPRDVYTIEAFTNDSSEKPVVQSRGNRLAVHIPGQTGSVRYLVRGPQGVTLNLATRAGSINVADVPGVVDATTGTGDIKVLVSGYANAYAKTGNVTVFFGSTDWPGTLHFGAGTGNVEVWINATAKLHVHLHTDNGSIFTDFPLKGTSHGTNETIDGSINGGANRGVDIEIHSGVVRVLQLKPQV